VQVTDPTQDSRADTDRLYRLLIESVRDYALFTLDRTGRIMNWNPGAERFKGYTAAEAIGQHFSIFYPAADRAAGKPEYELVVAAAEGRFEDEGWRLRKDGSRFWANVVITALHEHDELVGFAKVTRDLTDRVAAEARAREDARRVAEAEAANRTKTEFLTALSHELRTPLNAISGYVDLLLLGVRGSLTGPQLHDLQRIRQSQQHLLGIINDLLNYSRIGAGRITYDIRTVPLHDAVDNVLALIAPQAQARNIRLVRNARADTEVRADAVKLEQILLNLLTNALKFSADGATVRIDVVRSDEVGVVRVADTGVGIPADRLDAIFEPFVQVGRSLTSPHAGTGLGLAISRDLARAMNGDLTVDSALGAGSTFTLSLPLA
jgi:PAS domain S-box-containing protein